MERKQDLLARRGLTLPKRVLGRLNQVGIFVQSQVSLEHQSLAKRYVVRGVESGGAIEELGRYVSFCAPDGEPLAYLHPIDAIGVNGLHAVVVAPVLVRIEVLRSGRTWQLLITRHEPATAENGRRPALESSILFRGVNGFLDNRLQEVDDPDGPLPQFWSRAGEPLEIPPKFASATRAAARGASCVGCSHTHYLVSATPAAAIAKSA
ncbi:MAG: hypothetical protein L0338_38885 [Acidobacteria bacterium]|nr:hypothetical protein [Acidobacteriota bacterium]